MTKQRCGQRIYDDYTELQPGAVQRLERHLWNHTQSPSSTGTNSQSNATAGYKDAMTGLVIRFKDIFTSGKDWRLPSYYQPSRQSVKTIGECPRTQQAPPTSHDFALLCIPFMERASKLYQPEICRINSDQEFFRLLRYYYASQRGVRTWARLRKVQAINFVKVSKTPACSQDIRLPRTPGARLGSDEKRAQCSDPYRS